MMVTFIDQYRDVHRFEPICKELPIAPSTYHQYKTLEQHPQRCSAREKCGEQLAPDIQRVWKENHRNYGERKVWKQLKRESVPVARCTVERLMKNLSIKGVRRGRRCITTIPSEAAHKPLDLVNREFSALHPNQLWVADITYVATWSGFVYVAFVIDVFSRYIVGWRVLTHMQTDLILDALEQALWARAKPKGVIHHSDGGSQYLSIRYTDRLTEAGFNSSVGSVGDSYDNALAETINGLYKAEVIHKDSPWRGLDDVERATLTWVEWFNNRRLLRPSGDRPPAQFEMMYHQQTESSNVA
jgi:putative transposase